MKHVALLIAMCLPVAAEELQEPLRSYDILAVHRVYDGDTFECKVDIGWGLTMEYVPVRLYGIDTPEIRPLKSREAATKSRDFLRDWIEACPMPKLVVGYGEAGNPQRDKYGRVLARVDCEGEDVTDEMIAQRLGKPYFGGTK